MWYTVSLFFRSDHGDALSPAFALWEEVHVLINAEDEETATRSAEAIGRAREHGYGVLKPTPHDVKWTFVKVERVHGIEGPLADGTEVFSRFLRAAEAESLFQRFDDDGPASAGVP
jgi:hypothetical protein